ncbi:MAG: type II secretion system protein J [Verrucomicrobiales bacterium]
MNYSHHKTGSAGGFTFIELLIASAISALVMATGVMVYMAIATNSRSHSSLVEVTLDQTTLQNYYNLDSTVVSSYSAPNFGRSAVANAVRELFYRDAAKASAVFSLGRSGLNTVRPYTLSYPTTGERVRLDSADTFLTFLTTNHAEAATIFSDSRGDCTTDNASIFMLGSSDSVGTVPVVAVYDVDFVAATAPAGIYASVKRYFNGSLTDYYDIFYPDKGVTGASFKPVWVGFEMASRVALNEGPAIDRFKLAPKTPFYLMWWPDPGVSDLVHTPASTVTGATNPLSTYYQMGGRTSLVMAYPMFPSL